MTDLTGHRERLPLSSVLVVAWGMAAAVVLLSVGRGGDLVDSIVLLPQVLLWAAPGLAYLLSGIGLGLLARPLVRGSGDEAVLIVGIGVGLLAAVSQVSGCLGLLTSRVGAIALLVPGWVALVRMLWSMRTVRVRIPRLGPLAWLSPVPVAVLVVAACAPPGWLWDSEFGGFDALSYHLMLPQEWIRAGRIEPLQHCVYSFLPGSYEAGVLHLAGITGVGGHEEGVGAGRGGGFGLLAGSGWRAVSAQFLHAWLTILAAWMVGRAGAAAVRAGGGNAAWSHRAGAIAGALALATPWSVVTGSLAYNEMPVVGLGAAALVAALDTSLRAWRRGLVCGLLVGAACGFKPTAMTFLTPGLGIVLLARTHPRQWWGCVVAGAAAGATMLAPWLVRNWLACGNPVFPFGAGIFGSAHWSGEQVARYLAGHSFHGSWLDRLVLLVGPDDGAGATRPGVVRDVERWRGVLNPQYAALFPAAIGALIGGGLRLSGVRSVLALLGVMLALQTAAWMGTTHLQARFLLPLIIPACVALGVALGWVRTEDSGTGRATLPDLRSRACLVIALGLVAWQCVALVRTFLSQRAGAPNQSTTAGPALFTGEYLADPVDSAAAFIGRALPGGSRVYLLGDAAPFYLDAGLGGEGAPRVLWHTTWDRSPLGEAMRSGEGPIDGEPAAWTARLRGLGVTHVLANFSELSRYQRRGWYDPEVTPERVTRWIDSLGSPVVTWDRTRQALYALPILGASEPGGGGGNE